MQRIAFYGKGGIGKSTIATGASIVLAQMGKRVLHVGCDPKHDSSLVLVKDPNRFKTVMDFVFRGDIDELEPEDLLMDGIYGIRCVESGGPEAGQGCGGRAVSRSFEVFDEIDLVDEDAYDVAIYDVLGDVVCGGFAAPMRKSAGSKVVVVLSEEMMAAYAANRIAHATKRFAENGIALAGLVVNLRYNQADLHPIAEFAKALNTRVLQVLPRDPLVCEAELYRKSIVDYAPDSPVALGIGALVHEVLALDKATLPVATPVDDLVVRQILRAGLPATEMPEAPRHHPKSTITDWARLP